MNCIDGKWKIKGEETEEMKGTQKCFVYLNDYKNVTQGILMKSLEEEKKAEIRGTYFAEVPWSLGLQERIIIAQLGYTFPFVEVHA